MVKIGQSWDDKLIEDISNDFENFGKYFESIESFLQIEKKIIQNLADIPIKLNDLKGDLLTRAEHYFEAVGKLKLTANKKLYNPSIRIRNTKCKLE